MRALISVSDKTGVVDLARGLHQLQFEILSTGGTAKTLKEAGVPATEVGDLTGFPEILGGRVKTLHPKIFGGILYERDNAKHKEDVARYDIPDIDWVIVNLYPFEKIHLENRISKSEMIEFIDIGGVSLLRAAAKNFKDVVVLTDQKDYANVLKEVQENKLVSIETKRMLASKAFGHTSHYDSMIARFFREQRVQGTGLGPHATALIREDDVFPEELTVGLRKVSNLRYGENPQQKAALYQDSGGRDWGVVHADKLQGKELSFNNYLDLDAAWQIVNSFDLSQNGSSVSNDGHYTGVCCVIIKHTNPCGVAISKTPLEAFQTAFTADPLSAFGGIIGFSSTVDKETAQEISKSFYECVIAPDYAPEALEIFKKKVNLRILRQKTMLNLPYELDVKKISGGMLVQEKDMDKTGDSKVVSRRGPTAEEMYSLGFAWKICKNVKSNAIVLARGTVTHGVGAGQMSRVDSLKASIQKMLDTRYDIKDKEKIAAAWGIQPVSTATDLPLVMASDAFFPFRDCVDIAAKNGVTAIIQPGGSIRDQDSIDAANEHNIAMVFTGLRHFRH